MVAFNPLFFLDLLGNLDVFGFIVKLICNGNYAKFLSEIPSGMHLFPFSITATYKEV